MTKGKKHDSLGRVLIKSRNRKLGRNINQETVAMYTTDIDPKDERKKLYSNTDMSNNLENFLELSEMEQRVFEAEKQNVVVLMKTSSTVLSKEEREIKTLEHKQQLEKNNQFWNSLTIPRRPFWDENTTTEQLLASEKESFYNWRRSLAKLEEDNGLIITPFEKNPEVWKQLWRVAEKSDVLVQIVDARNPLLFRSPDLERYAKELNPLKSNLLVVNKADLLTKVQRRKWAKYFESEGIDYRFFSAHKEQLKIEKRKQIQRLIDEGADIDLDEIQKLESKPDEDKETKIYTREEILDEFKLICPKPLTENSRFQGKIVVGLSGYPNVGKSSTINVLFGDKKVAVAATPGKTKYVQTIILEEEEIVLLDCPGLVFPTLLSSKAEMVINGLLPIDQLRDFVTPVDAICERVARSYLEDMYAVALPLPKEHEAQDRPPTGAELLSAYAYMRGFMTVHGAPDQSRAARIVLKDFVAGKLLFCSPPPGLEAEKFQRKTLKAKPESTSTSTTTTSTSPSGHQAPPAELKKKVTYDVSIESESNMDVQEHVVAKTKAKGKKKSKNVMANASDRFTRPIYYHKEETIETRLQKLQLKEQALKEMALKLKQDRAASSSSSSSTSTTSTTTTTSSSSDQS
ncbi:hypothetical protein SAMD00019534_103740 [Acytostelium subglobosum LB1]|uniref:hypothetical protein n=1 Tax=Acytostelium subglobosum LB1 TaxID=1410327 RepID=UPI000644D669|nr:hypothetical protein SAMD00019534_103740 [Acytostelium subglobosum LB1]GAM27199.1 hypothetical protein SAMD00019534_103740 [Acytostelium subglobosum LB1]|eukprot:XP_012749666.1 hypothetical protein SAMD00019534_103740 [Acytostelium subglobosum LB1]